MTVIGNGRDALAFLRSSDPLPLAVFLDLHLPGLGGIEVLEQIRRESRLERLPVVVMTGSVDPNDVDACTRLGGDGVSAEAGAVDDVHQDRDALVSRKGVESRRKFVIFPWFSN